MLFTWDDTKDKLNQSKHGVSFPTAAEVFADPFCVFESDRIVQGEERLHIIGSTAYALLLVVVCTVSDDETKEHVRIISARKVKRNERRIYENGVLRAQARRSDL